MKTAATIAACAATTLSSSSSAASSSSPSVPIDKRQPGGPLDDLVRQLRLLLSQWCALSSNSVWSNYKQRCSPVAGSGSSNSPGKTFESSSNSHIHLHHHKYYYTGRMALMRRLLWVGGCSVVMLSIARVVLPFGNSILNDNDKASLTQFSNDAATNTRLRTNSVYKSNTSRRNQVSSGTTTTSSLNRYAASPVESIMSATATATAKSSSGTVSTSTATTHGLVDCAAFSDINRHIDPNQGRLYARTLLTEPTHFWISVHAQQYDPVRWKSIYKKGAYYEHHVHQHFVTILSRYQQQSQSSSAPSSPLVVLDVGMNIGYYSLLAASLGATHVASFEINPRNILRMCESLRLNDNFAMSSSSISPLLQTQPQQPQVDIYQRGVAQVDNQVLAVHVPASNPGQASLQQLESKSQVQRQKSNDQATTAAGASTTATTTTITLDSYAQQQGWLPAQTVEQAAAAQQPSGTTRSPPTIAILKIDVEGLEPNVLLGAKRLLQANLIRNVLTEFRDLDSAVSQQALTLLVESGYRLVDSRITLSSSQSSQSSTVFSPRVMTLEQTTWYLQRLQHNPLWYDLHKTKWEKFKAYVTRTLVVDLWFTLADDNGDETKTVAATTTADRSATAAAASSSRRQ